MDANRFDRWTVALIPRPTRRATLRLLAGGLVGALLSPRDAAPLRAAQVSPDDLLTCTDTGLTDCGGVCADLSSDEFHCGGCFTACGGLPCLDGVCRASAVVETGGQLQTCGDQGLADCGDACADLLSDPNHCGLCQWVCEAGQFCQNGSCEDPVCLLTHCLVTERHGPCVDLASDPNHCGACFTSCPLGGFCEGGTCR